MVTVDLQDKPQKFLDVYALANPIAGARAKVPLLQVLRNQVDEQNVVLCESLILSQYLAEKHGVLLPSCPEDCAIMRLFTDFCTFSYFPLLKAKNEKLEGAIQTFREELVATDTFLTHYGMDQGPFLFGTTFSLAESNAAPFLQRACTILPALTGQGEGHPANSVTVNPMDICDELGLVRLKQWIEAVLSRPSVVATGVPKEELVQRTKSMLERFAQMEQTSQ